MAPKGKTVKKPAASDAAARSPQETEDADDGNFALKEKVAKFQEKVKQLGIKDSPDITVLKGFFSKTELSQLWVELKRARGKADVSVREAWNTINQMKNGKTAANNVVLWNQIVMPSEWQSRMLNFVKRSEKSHEKSAKKEEHPRGQLIQQHGYEEAMDMIERGKVVEQEDSDGDLLYVRQSKAEIASEKKTGTVETKRTVR